MPMAHKCKNDKAANDDRSNLNSKSSTTSTISSFATYFLSFSASN